MVVLEERIFPRYFCVPVYFIIPKNAFVPLIGRINDINIHYDNDINIHYETQVFAHQPQSPAHMFFIGKFRNLILELSTVYSNDNLLFLDSFINEGTLFALFFGNGTNVSSIFLDLLVILPGGCCTE